MRTTVLMFIAALVAALLGGCGSSSPPLTPGSTAVYFSTAVLKGYSTGFARYSTIRGAGYDGFGQLGDGATTNRSTFGRIPLPIHDVAGISLGGYHSLVFSSYSVWSAGGNGSGQLGRGVTTGRGQDERFALVAGLPSSADGVTVRGVFAGAAHSAVLYSDGKVWTFGANDRGQLGNGSTVASTAPMTVLDDATLTSPLGGIVELSAGAAHALARDGNGYVFGWGYNGYGQLGDGTFTNRVRAVRLPSFGNLTTARSIAAGGSFSAVIDDKDRLYLFGNNGSGQIGVPWNGPGGILASAAPVLLTGIDPVKKVALGTAHLLILTRGGDLYTLGYNGFGQLGNGTKVNSPQPVRVMTGVSEVAAFGHSSYALKGGTWYGWGDNARGQLGYDTGNLTYSATPLPIPGL